MKKNNFLILFCLLLGGCGAAITGVGVVLTAQSSGDRILYNDPPTVAITTPSAGEALNDLISITYKLYSPQWFHL